MLCGAADPELLDDPELFAAASGGVAGAGVTTPSRRNKHQGRRAGMQQRPAAAVADASKRLLSDEEEDEEDVQPAKRARRGRLPLTGRLAGLSSRAVHSLVDSESEADDICDTVMQDAEAGVSAAAEQDSTLQLTPRTLFPSLCGSMAANSKSVAATRQGSKAGGFSSKLVGMSSHVPNLATFVSKTHAVAVTGELATDAVLDSTSQALMRLPPWLSCCCSLCRCQGAALSSSSCISHIAYHVVNCLT